MSELNLWEKAMGWRKRQMVEYQLKRDDNALILQLKEDIKHARNDTLEEVAREFDRMKALGDTAASFAIFVRNMKQ
jgi:hypothetical protein